MINYSAKSRPDAAPLLTGNRKANYFLCGSFTSDFQHIRPMAETKKFA